jgi:putative transposase
MKNTTRHTYNINFRDDKQGTVLNLSRESAEVYNQSIDLFWNNLDNGTFLSKFDLQQYVNIPRTLLLSESYIGSIQLAHTALTTYFAALKVFKVNPEAFTGCPRQPIGDKQTQLIIFKKDAIRFKNGYLLLSTKDKPLKFRWDINKGLPVFASISWKRETGWKLNLILEEEKDILEFVEDKLMSIDLGVKRIAATYDLERVITYSGKVVMSLNRLRNKINGETQSKLSGLKKHSRRYKKIKQANRQVAKRINNKISDILHKYSRTIVNDCIKNNIKHIIVGDCAGIHDGPKFTKETNQKIVQCPEQKLLKYIKYKFEEIGGVVLTTSEAYTSRTCPCCGKVKNSSPSGRTFKCQGCGFIYDRDGVGAINIYQKFASDCETIRENVSLENVSFGSSDLDVVGGLTPPIGWKYASSRDCLIRI